MIRCSRPTRGAIALALVVLGSGCAAIRAREAEPPIAPAGAARGTSPLGIAPPDAAPPVRGEPVWRAPRFGPRGRLDGAAPLDDAPAPLDATRSRVVAAARALVGTRAGGDCSGFVLRVLREAELAVRLEPARSRSESLFRAGREVDAPRPGDLAFFHDTYDRNRDRRLNDRFTHVGVVEAVDGATVVLVHRGGKGVERLRMNLAHPADPATNDQLRIRRRGDAPTTRYLAGQLFAAFGELLDRDLTRMLQAGRVSETGARHPAAR
jgi:hypothetical protein